MELVRFLQILSLFTKTMPCHQVANRQTKASQQIDDFSSALLLIINYQAWFAYKSNLNITATNLNNFNCTTNNVF